MRQAPLRILLLLLSALFALAVTQTQRYEFKHSFRAPFYLGRGGTLPFWEFGGSAIVSEDRIRLTSTVQSRVGWVWNSVPADMDAWEVQMDFEIGGGGSRGADGLAMWYVADPKQEGIAMGSKEVFTGMALFFDTFDNDGQNDEPRISLWVNDGTQRYDPFNDGRHGEKGNCRNLNREVRSKVRVVYRDGVIQVDTDSGGGNWAPCITHHEALPKGLFFGLSAATGHLIDNHDVYSFITYNLDPWRRRSPAPVRRQEYETNEPEQSAEPTQPETVQQQYHHQEEQPQEHQHVEQQIEQHHETPYSEQQEQHQHEQQQEQQQRHEQPTQQQHQQQQSQQQPISQDEIEKLGRRMDLMKSELSSELAVMKESILSQVSEKINGLQHHLNGEVRSVPQQVQNLAEGSSGELRRLVQDTLNQLGKAVTDLKGHTSSELGNNYNNVARLVRELQQQQGALQTLVERGDREQNSVLQDLKSSKEELRTVVEKSGSVAWWVYFAFFQVCFGVAYVLWKRAREDANKKFL